MRRARRRPAAPARSARSRRIPPRDWAIAHLLAKMLPAGQIVAARAADVVDEIVETLLEIELEHVGQYQPAR